MKTTKFLIAGLLAVLCGMSSCKSDDKGKETYPQTTILGERTCTGEIVMLPNPPTNPDEPALPGTVLGLKTNSGDYLLTFSGQWTWDESATIGGTTYTTGDQVNITGTVSTTKISADHEYTELEVKTIKKLDR